MPLEQQIKAVVESLPEGTFQEMGSEVFQTWAQFVVSVHDPVAHPAAFYVIVARALAELMGTAAPQDYADDHMRTMILDMIKPNAQPFSNDESGPHKELRLRPAHVSCALLVQATAKKQFAAPASSGGGLADTSGLSEVMAEYVKAQKAALDKDKKKGTLPYKLHERLEELGLKRVPEDAKPSEEALLKVESLAKVARTDGRKWLGSAEGEDLQANFRPSWSRVPSLETFAGSGCMEEKCRGWQQRGRLAACMRRWIS